MLLTGTYVVRARTWKLGKASTGTDQVELDFHCAAMNDGIRAYLYFSEASADRSLQALRDCGWDGVDFSDLAGLGSCDVEIVVGEEEYKGKISQKVKWINAIGGNARPAASDMSDKDRRSFVARMNARLRQSGAAPKAPTTSAPRSERPQDDDIPF